MTEAQKALTSFCKDLQKDAAGLELSDMAAKACQLEEGIKERELIIPVIGVFSAGKSTLINSIIGRELLPTAITPETSLATEMRYSADEHIEAVKEGGAVDKYKIEEIGTVAQKAAQYTYARLFLNNNALKEILPLVLVDMPGFDSPLDQHNKAISEYLERGCHYIVLSSAEDGTPPKTLLRRLKLIDDFEASFSFYLSKTNLKTEGTVRELLSHYKETLEDGLDMPIQITPLGSASGGEIVALLKAVNANNLYYRIFRGRLGAFCVELIDCINVRLRAAKSTIENNKTLIDELEESVTKIKSKCEELKSDISGRYSEKLVTGIVEKDVGGALNNALDELVSISMKGNSDSVSQRVNDIIHQTLLSTTKRRLGDLSERIAGDFALSLDGISDDSRSPVLSSQIIEDISDAVGDSIIGAVVGTAAGPIGIAINIVVQMLPSIIALFQKNKQKEELRDKFRGTVFPNILARLKSDIPNQLDEEIKKMIEKTEAEYEEKIERRRNEIQAALAEKQESAEHAAEEEARLLEIQGAVEKTQKEIIAL